MRNKTLVLSILASAVAFAMPLLNGSAAGVCCDARAGCTTKSSTVADTTPTSRVRRYAQRERPLLRSIATPRCKLADRQ